MAKRKRLAPAQALETGRGRAPETKSFTRFPPASNPAEAPARPPIAHVAGDAASAAAVEALADELREAREGGRMVVELPLHRIDETYLVRDRVINESDEMQALVTSIRERGQQTPIEVVALEDGRYGLISGWRRLMALRWLAAEEGPGADTAKALLRRPDGAAEAYRAMVEENEIRVGLSYYERARIVARAAEMEVYHTEALALKGLFGAASRAKRSKIGKFVKLYKDLDNWLRYPGYIPERLGLKLAARLEDDPKFAELLCDRLRKTPPQSPDEEIAFIERALAGKAENMSLTPAIEPVSQRNTRSGQASEEGAAIRISRGQNPNTLVLSGPGITPAFQAELEAWLTGRG